MATTRKLPTEVFSVLGNMPLKRGREDCPSDALGFFGAGSGRFVAIHPDCPKEQLWQVYWHEAIHTALYDSGVENHIDDKTLEAICDSVGTYLAAMMQARMLRVVQPKDK